ncbi:hypothetical protein D3C81_1556830 [compost metagenome]
MNPVIYGDFKCLQGFGRHNYTTWEHNFNRISVLIVFHTQALRCKAINNRNSAIVGGREAL